jgi:hypothetical protein
VQQAQKVTLCGVPALPGVEESFVGLLGLSHAYYLALKAADKPAPRPAAGQQGGA